MTLRFEQKSTLGFGWELKVLDGAITKGFIRKRPDTGAFCYFRGTSFTNINSTYEDSELERLKEKVKQNP